MKQSLCWWVQRDLIVDSTAALNFFSSRDNAHNNRNPEFEGYLVANDREAKSCTMVDPLSVLGAAVGVTSLILQLTDECIKDQGTTRIRNLS
jgi:hypothetical protein